MVKNSICWLRDVLYSFTGYNIRVRCGTMYPCLGYNFRLEFRIESWYKGISI